MMFHRSDDGLLAITQPSHALLSGQIMRGWGNADFDAPAPLEPVCLAAEQHDIGWLPWERAPGFNPDTGLPRTFREVPIPTHTGIWRQGTAFASVLGRYCALLVSLHGTGLYSAFNFATATAGNARTVRAFLREQTAFQRRAVDHLRDDDRYGPHCTPAAIERNRGLVRTADRLSIAVCTRLRDLAVRTDDPAVGIVRQVPTHADATEGTSTTDLIVRTADHRGNAMTVDPWPFATDRLDLMCEAIPLPPTGFPDAAAMRAALDDASPTTLAVTLHRPG